MIVEFEYDYWGENGRYSESRLGEFDSLKQCVQELSNIAYYNAIDDKLDVLRVIGGEDGDAEKIRDGIAVALKEIKRKSEITKIKERIDIHQKFLDNVSSDIAYASQRIVTLHAELEELEKE